LNIQSIVSQLVAVESQPVQLLQKKSSVLQTKMSVFGQVKSELSAVQDAASALMDATTWDSKTFTSNSASVVTGTATSGALASSFSLEVTSLASGQSLKTNPLTGYVAPADDTLNIRMGSWDAAGTTFTAGTGAAVPISIKANATLSEIASSINAQSTAAGVTATVVTNGATQQLLIRGTGTGANSAFQIVSASGSSPFSYAATETLDGLGASQVPPKFTNGGPLIKTQTAADAAITIDGIAVTSATNTVTDAVPGVTLNLLAKTTTAAQITVAVDKDAIKTKIQAFQDAYNKLNADLKAQTKYDAATKTGGPLLGDSTTVGLQSMLRSLVGAKGPTTSSIDRLSNLGLEIQADGSLKTNATKLDVALQDPANVKAFFSASTGTASSNGIARRIYDFAFGATAVGGSVSSHSAGFQKSIDQNSKAIDKFNTHIADYQKQLLAQYTRLDTNMSTLNSLSTFVNQQVAQWNKTG
jgi:flagellar hook-associated protein 2